MEYSKFFQYCKVLLLTGYSSSSATNNVKVEAQMNFPNVKNYNEFVREMQHDTKFESMIQDMTINALSKNRSLNKFGHRF